MTKNVEESNVYKHALCFNIPKPWIASPEKDIFDDAYIETGKLIGRGGFSKVYEVTIGPHEQDKGVFMSKLDFDNRKRHKRNGALKYISPSKNSGLESSMEMHIMTQFLHPTINRGLQVNIDYDANVSIIQNLSLSDVTYMIRNSGHKLTPKDLRRWIWSLTCGVAHLHSNGILHGDIKCGNLLLYYKDDNGPKVDINKSGLSPELSNVDVRLNDFSLSRFIPTTDDGTQELPYYLSYTSTHRPIEVWKRNKYSFSADAWALGCTLYEMTYGMLLFPNQDSCDNQEMNANINAFNDWFNYQVEPDKMPICKPKTRVNRVGSFDELAPGIVVPDLNNTNDDKGSPPFRHKSFSHVKSKPIDIIQRKRKDSLIIAKSAPSRARRLSYNKLNISSAWANPENHLVNELIIGLLNINPLKRMTIWDVIDHEYFKPIRGVKGYEELLPPPEECCFSNIAYTVDNAPQDLIKEMGKYTKDENITGLAISLYQRAWNPEKKDTQPSVKACIITASKLLYRGPPVRMKPVSKDDLKNEILLCKSLNYNLLAHSKCHLR